MKVKVITGQLACQPVVLSNESQALVLIVVKNNEGYREAHRNSRATCLNKSLSWNYANTIFSHIATSSIGETVEIKISDYNGEILDFKNITRQNAMCK